MGRAAAAGPKLTTFVHVTDDKGVSRAFGPDDDVPAWAQRKITNPKAWEGGELPKVRAASKPAKDGDTAAAPDPDDEPETAAAEEEPASQDDGTETDDETAAEDDETDASEEAPSGEKPPVPPREGAGSGKAAWHAYAQAVGLDVAKETTRDEVIELLEDAGLLEDEQA
jgi:hypothetical protein